MTKKQYNVWKGFYVELNVSPLRTVYSRKQPDTGMKILGLISILMLVVSRAESKRKSTGLCTDE